LKEDAQAKYEATREPPPSFVVDDLVI
jgi:hypothetical protein